MTVDVSGGVRADIAATERYRAALNRDPGVFASTFNAALAARRLMYRDRPLSSTIEPRFITADDYAHLRRECEVAIGLIERADRAFRTRQHLREPLIGRHPLRYLIEAHAEYLPEPVGRFDALVEEAGELKFIEFNAGLCGGLYVDEAVAEVFETLEPMQAVRRHAAPRFEATGVRFAEALHVCHRRYRHRPLTTLAFVLPDGPVGDHWDDHNEIRLMKAEIERQGVEARFVRVSEIDYSGNAMRVGDWTIDAACVFDWAALLEAPGARPLLQVDSVPHTWIVNPLGAAIHRGGKHLFALLSDPALGIFDDPAERSWVDRHIPWTRMVVEGDTSGPDGAVGPLVDHLRRHQADLVLKPCFSMGGRGVVLGWKADPEVWEAAIAAALREPYVVQRRVAMPAAPYVVSVAGRVTERMLEGDLCCYMWPDGSAYGLHSRLSESGLMNLGSGGASIVPVYVVD